MTEYIFIKLFQIVSATTLQSFLSVYRNIITHSFTKMKKRRLLLIEFYYYFYYILTAYMYIPVKFSCFFSLIAYFVVLHQYI